MSSKLPRLRFYLDENFPVSAGKFLKYIAQNVKFAIHSDSTRSKSDIWQLKYATKDRRILLALDNDFKYTEALLELAIKSPGVLLVQSANPTSEKVIQILKSVIKKLTQNKISGKICIASINKISFIDPNKLMKE